jgi:tRNA 2-selenouridine synthase
VEQTLDSRIDTVLNDYINSNYEEFKRVYSDSFEQRFADFLLSSLARIQKRLGSENYINVKQAMEDALQAQQQSGTLSAHRQWIERLLVDYYDPMYDYQLDKKSQKVVFRGNPEELRNWAAGINESVMKQ